MQCISLQTKSNKKSTKSSKVPSHNGLKPKKSFPTESDDDDQTAGRETIIAFDTDTDEEDTGAGSPFIGKSIVSHFLYRSTSDTL